MEISGEMVGELLADRWGVTQAEVDRRYPCDDIVPTPAVQAWRGVTVRAPQEAVWPWVAQIRLAPYSYDWIDNFGRRSPQQLTGLRDPIDGEPFTTCGPWRLGRVLSADPPNHITGRIAATVISYVVVPTGDNTRLLMKLVAGWSGALAPLLTVGDLVMARRQLRTLARLAEDSPVPAAS